MLQYLIEEASPLRRGAASACNSLPTNEQGRRGILFIFFDTFVI
eukprot:COSAG02_NODE_2183_length_9581_cov_22.013394_11_plen_44_part_00